MNKIPGDFLEFLMQVDDPQREKEFVLAAGANFLVGLFHACARDASYMLAVFAGQQSLCKD